VNQFSVYVTPDALREIRTLPGNVRQRVRRVITDLATNPFPPQSRILDVPGVEMTVCRTRLERWRIIYAVSERDAVIDVLGVRRRPPYDYEDLERLLAGLG
jgi:mRNA interferase RelE/StbE